MASITKQVIIDAPADEVWDALRDFGAVHERLAPGFVVDARLEDGARLVTFVNGAVAREVLVDVDDDARRLVYSVVESPLQSTHDNSSAQVVAGADGLTRFVWIKDVLPHELAPRIDELMEQGISIVKQTLESRSPAGRGTSRRGPASGPSSKRA